MSDGLGVSGFVLDASALLALLLGEPGEERVREVLSQSVISSVNLAEAVSKLAERMPPKVARQAVEEILPEIVDFTTEHAMIAGELRPATRPLGLSLGDRACLALAKATGAVALTMDRQWAMAKVGVAIEVGR